MHRRSVLAALGALAVAFVAMADDAPAPPPPPPAPGDAPRQVASATKLPLGEVAGLVEEVLPPPPRTAALQTHYYGVIRLDHQAHLERRTSCRTCHGPGPVGKIDLPVKTAHERCVGCHTQQAAGPTACKGCHDTAPPAPPPVITASRLSTPVVAAAPLPPTSEQRALLAVGEGGPGTVAALQDRISLVRVLETGGVAGRGTGLSLRLSSRSDALELSHSVDRVVARADTRTIGMFGVGAVRPLRHRFALSASGLAGFDVLERPGVAFLPALGARVGIDWTPPPAWFVRRFQLTLTGISDLGRADFGARRLGGWTGYATLSTGFSLSGSSP